ncbi:MAG: hypothetical protein HY270_07870 [Deltaproteobacteria bacterium]|nr:hypothetical protein [Deltaproteobacteria bacterium]
MKPDFAPWLQFESRLAAWMQSFATSALRFRAGRQAIPGFPSDGFRADALLTNSQVLLALEVEVKQTHPDTNVGKYWLLSEHHEYKKIVLFHVYTPAYSSYGWRKTLGEFYARRMSAELPFEYVLLDKKSSPDTETAFAEVCAVLELRIRQEFSHELAPGTVQQIAAGDARNARA